MISDPQLAAAFAAAGVDEANVLADIQIEGTMHSGHRGTRIRFTAIGEYETIGRRLPTTPDAQPLTRFEAIRLDDGPFHLRMPEQTR